MAGMQKLRIGIIGSGALGLYFGIRLAVTGHAVSFLVRSGVEQVRDRGMRLELADGRILTLPTPNIVKDVREMGGLDWVLVALKTTQNKVLEELLMDAVVEGTSILTLQNGIGNVEAIEAICPESAVLAGLCQIGVNREAPGEVRSFVPDDGFVQIGQDVVSGKPDLRSEYANIFEAAGIRTRVTASLGEALWRKLMWNVPFNGLTVEAGGVGTDVICSNPEQRARARRLMEEIRLAAEALGFPIERTYTDRLIEFTDKIGSYRASTVLDWLEGRPLEIEAIFRKPLERGESSGVSMPELKRLTLALEAMTSGH